MKGLRLILILALLPLAACTTVGPDYTPSPPPSITEAGWIRAHAWIDSERATETAWWRTFADPLLDRLMEQATLENIDLRAAEARVARAHALRRDTAADFYPRLDAEAGYSRQRASRSNSDSPDNTRRRTLYDLGLSASWEIDLFGGTRRADEAAAARIETEIERRHALHLAVLAEVARNYYAVRGAQRRIAITAANIELQSRTFTLVENLYSLGEASEFDLSRARGQLQLTQSRLPELNAEMHGGIYRLSILLGSPPGALLDEMLRAAPLPQLPDRVPIGQPSDLLRRRPDIRVAERELAAATADIGTVTADLFPRFTLLGSLGRSGSTIDDLRHSLSNRDGFSSFVRWPVFQGGRIRAQLRAEKAEAEEAAANYEQTVLEALGDAETALVRYLSRRETKALLRDAVASRQRSVELARNLFNAGEEDFLSVLDAERELLASEDELVLSDTDAVLRLITLYTALGGGWDPPADE